MCVLVMSKRERKREREEEEQDGRTKGQKGRGERNCAPLPQRLGRQEALLLALPPRSGLDGRSRGAGLCVVVFWSGVE